jgi:hypothetical protein
MTSFCTAVYDCFDHLGVLIEYDAPPSSSGKYLNVKICFIQVHKRSVYNRKRKNDIYGNR